MERIHAETELTRVQAGTIALADELLTHKPEDSPLSFVDIVFTGDQQAMYAELQQSSFAELLADDDEQLAIESDGSYYPELDIRKSTAQFMGMSLRVWGWDSEKVRLTDADQSEPASSRKYKVYPGETDKTRQLEITMVYQAGEETVQESVSVYASTSQKGSLHASSHIWMPAYAETGYEGHGTKLRYDLSDEVFEDFLKFVASHIGDEPKSFAEKVDEQLNSIRDNAKQSGQLEAVERLIEVCWPAQALRFMDSPAKELNGFSIAQALQSQETAVSVPGLVDKIIVCWNKGGE